MSRTKILDEVVTWQTCDDECPATEYYRIIAREEWDIGRVEFVRQQRVDGEWVDDETVGEPAFDGSYSIGGE